MQNDTLNLIIQTLGRNVAYNPLLVSESGARKTLLVQELARRMANQNVPEYLKDKQIVTLDVGAIMAAASPEEARGQVRTMLETAENSDRKIMVFIDDLHLVVSTQGSGLLKVGEFVAKLVRGRLQIIGGTNVAALRQHLETHRPLQARLPAIFC